MAKQSYDGQGRIGRGLARRAVGWLLLLVVMFAGCGSTSTPYSSQETRRDLAAIKAAKRDITVELEAGHYRKACDDFTVRARTVMGIMMEAAKGSCAAGFAHYDDELHNWGMEEPAHLINGKPRIRKFSTQEIHSIYQGMSSPPSSSALSRAQIKGDAASYNGRVLARYEQDRWRIERIQPEVSHKQIAFYEKTCELLRQSCGVEVRTMTKAMNGESISIPEDREVRRLMTTRLAKYQKSAAVQQRLRRAFSGSLLPGGRQVRASH